jgi:hypothetical protein
MSVRNIILLIVWLCFSINHEGYSQNFLNQAKTQEIDIGSYFFLSELVIIDDLLFIKIDKQDYGIVVYDLTLEKEIFKFGRRGRGPAEYLNFSIQKGPGKNLLEITDSANRKNDIYDVSCIKQNLSLETLTNCIIYSIPNSATSQALTFSNESEMVFNKGSSVDGILWESEKEVIVRYLKDAPNKLKEKYERPIHSSLASTGKITANYKRDRFAYFADSFDWSLFYELDSDSLRLINENTYSYLPDFEVIDFGSSSYLETGEEYKAAFASPVAGQSHYFVLYSGKTSEDVEMTEGAEWRAFTNRVKVFDFNGNEIQEIILDEDLFIITVNYDESMIYGITIDRELNPSILKAEIK